MRQCILCGKMFEPQVNETNLWNNICSACDASMEIQWKEVEKTLDNPTECVACSRKLTSFERERKDIYCILCQEDFAKSDEILPVSSESN